MRSTTGVLNIQRSSGRVIAALSVVASLAAACGDSSGGSLADDAQAGNGSSTEGSVDLTGPDESLVVGIDGYQGPDWMDPKMVVLLPEGLTVTLDLHDAATGSANLTGFVEDGHIDELRDDAAFMLRAGGYFIADFLESGTRSFSAERTTTDGGSERVLFGVVNTGDGIIQWSLEFINPDSEAETIDDVLGEAGLETGAIAVVIIGDQEWEVTGGCESGTFIGLEDGVTLSMGVNDTDGPVGSFSAPAEGGVLSVPAMTPATDYDVGNSGFFVFGTIEGIDWSVDVECAG